MNAKTKAWARRMRRKAPHAAILVREKDGKLIFRVDGHPKLGEHTERRPA